MIPILIRAPQPVQSKKKLLNMTSMCQCRHDRDTSAWRPSTSPPTPVSDCRLLADNRPHTNWTPPNQDPRLSEKECDGYTLGEPHPHHLLAPPLPRRRLLSRISTLTTLSVQGLLRNAGRWSPKEKKYIRIKLNRSTKVLTHSHKLPRKPNAISTFF